MMSSELSDFLLQLLNTPSPTGMTEQAVSLIEAEVMALGVETCRSRKGGLSWTLPGTDSGAGHLALSAHADTLGAMVKAVLPNGRLRLTQLGGYDWASIEGEYVTVHGQDGVSVTGTVVNDFQSFHVFAPQLRELRRSGDNLEVRLDAYTSSSQETRALGLEVGDFVSFEPRAVLTPAGYLKSRHIDNKASVAILLEVTRQLLKTPAPMTVGCFITTYEEVGHGAAPGFGEASEVIALDMAAVGRGQTSSEHHVTLCVKDSSGPYDHALGNRLRRAAQTAGIDLKVDIYPYYSSDASAAWGAGHDLPAALIGPGVDASHAYERTHLDALEATVALVLAYCHA
ncbi:M42 family metallopeptidase [Deinococcus detaillensis]|uniref:M42 family metallopeptidase n=2 Tax=Deinococcus detaillensis TaxID=2592048 RepID=A0A553V6C4_9DEIO|nr:M42 family metallopeptidase [Deinococcus detaillensis]TSA88023.1 M42 family metallopeptidase [Deinococcus detaillensis]